MQKVLYIEQEVNTNYEITLRPSYWANHIKGNAMLRNYIRNIMSDELAAAKEEGISKAAKKVIDKYLDKNLEGMVLRQATNPKVCAAFNELTKAIMEDDMSAYRGLGLLYEPFNFMKFEFDRLRERVKKSGEKEANKILSDFVYEKTAEDIDNLISDPKRLKIIISKINEFQVNSTGKV